MYTTRERRRTVRPAAVAGAFYPADPALLQQTVEQFMEAAEVPSLSDVRAVIAPHAGYVYSGPIAGASFRMLQQLPKRPRTVYLMGPAHYHPVNGVALGNFSALRTPLGEVPVAVEIVDLLAEQGPPFHLDVLAHLPEHCLEVELPFLQVALGGEIRVVPMLFGQVDSRLVAMSLVEPLRSDPNALVVVSSDLSHYHSYDAARKLDAHFLSAVLARDTAAASQGEACGVYPILTLMSIARQFGWQPVLLDARNSGDITGDKTRVVGYGAVAYTDKMKSR